MRLKKLISGCVEGHRMAMALGLSHAGNWKPIHIYIHCTRILIGFAIGTLFGLSLGLLMIILFPR